MVCFVNHEPDLWFLKRSQEDLSLSTFIEATSQPSNLYDSDVSLCSLIFQFSIALSGSEHDFDPAHVLPAAAPRCHPEVQRVQGHQRADFLCPLLAPSNSNPFRYQFCSIYPGFSVVCQAFMNLNVIIHYQSLSSYTSVVYTLFI